MDAPNYAALGRALGVSRDQVSKWRNRHSRPYEECLRVAAERGVSLDWLLLGIGEMSRAAPAAAAEEAATNRVADETDAAAWSTPAQPPARKEFGQRLVALAGLLEQLDPEHSEAIIADALSRATDAQRLAKLEQAIQQIKKEAKRRA